MRNEPRVWLEAPSLSASIVRELHTLTPPDQRLAYFQVGWRPDWERWCIWQMVPPHGVPAYLWGDDTRLVHRIERVLGRSLLRSAPDERYRLWLERGNMTRWAWALHVATGWYAQPLWVVQGSAGGHRWNFTDHEQKLLALKGLPTDPPEPGSLPYAPVDRRVLDKLIPLATRQVDVWSGLSRGLMELDERDLDTHEKALMQQANAELWKWLDTQIDSAADEAGVKFAPERGAGYQDADVDYEAIHQEFVESTD